MQRKRPLPFWLHAVDVRRIPTQKTWWGLPMFVLIMSMCVTITSLVVSRQEANEDRRYNQEGLVVQGTVINKYIQTSRGRRGSTINHYHINYSYVVPDTGVTASKDEEVGEALFNASVPGSTIAVTTLPGGLSRLESDYSGSVVWTLLIAFPGLMMVGAIYVLIANAIIDEFYRD